MAVTQGKLLATLRTKVALVAEETRVPDYQTQLLQTLSHIVLLEREHRESMTQIQKKVNDRVVALGDFLHTRGWNLE